MTPRRGMGELESEVMAQLWSSPSALTPSEVRDALGGELAYTTVMTVLGRLWEKGMARRERRGRAYAYWPSLAEADFVAQRMRAALDRTVDRETTLARFVGELSVKEERALRRILGSLTNE